MFDTLKRLNYIFFKNIMIVFRTWTSLFLLIIGPLLLILIVGFAFSENQLNDVRIGVIANDRNAISSVLNSIEGGGTLIDYSSYLQCIQDIKMNHVHVCMEFSDDFMVRSGDSGSVPTGNIKYYYDNSRTTISDAILDFLKGTIGFTSEQITLEATSKILGDIEQSVEFMRASKSDVKDMQDKGSEMRTDLYGLRDDLYEIRDEFKPAYNQIKSSQTQINNNKYKISTTKSTLRTQIDSLNSDLNSMYSQVNTVEWQLKEAINAIDNMDNAIENMDDTLYTALIPFGIVDFQNSLNSGNLHNLKSEVSDLSGTIPRLQSDLNSMSSQVDNAANDLEEMIGQFNSMVTELDKIDDFLDRAVEQSDESIENLDEGLDSLDTMSSTLTDNIDKFAGLDQDQASTLVTPITSEFKPLFKNKRFIDLLFPVLIPLIILFISILLANILVLSEKSSPAYFRNFIMPFNSFVHAIGIFLTALVLTGFQMSVLLLVAQLRFGIDILRNLPSIMAITTLLVLVFILIGMIIGYMIKSDQTSILICTFAALGMFLLSDVIFPLESMPTLAATIASMNPLVIGESVFRKILLFSLPIENSSIEMMKLGVYSVGLFCVMVLTYMFSKRRV